MDKVDKIINLNESLNRELNEGKKLSFKKIWTDMLDRSKKSEKEVADMLQKSADPEVLMSLVPIAKKLLLIRANSSGAFGEGLTWAPIEEISIPKFSSLANAFKKLSIDKDVVSLTKKFDDFLQKAEKGFQSALIAKAVSELRKMDNMYDAAGIALAIAPIKPLWYVYAAILLARGIIYLYDHHVLQKMADSSSSAFKSKRPPKKKRTPPGEIVH